jgi:predicted helicase
MKAMIGFYNDEVDRFDKVIASKSRSDRAQEIDRFVDTDLSKISWTRGLKDELSKGKKFEFDEKFLAKSLYRPFSRQWLYYNKTFNEMILQMPRIFADPNSLNRTICFPNKGEDRSFSVIMASSIPDLHLIHGGQCFPRYLYGTQDFTDTTLFGSDVMSAPNRRDAITDEGLVHFQAAYL